MKKYILAIIASAVALTAVSCDQSRLDIPQKGDVYFSPHAQIWGWATWADRWQYFRHYQSRSEALDGMTEAEIDALEEQIQKELTELKQLLK